MRGKFAKEWYNKGELLLNKYDQNDTRNSGLLFESYIYLWIALTVAAKEYCACNGKKFRTDNKDKSTDKEEILYWANKRKNKIIEILKEHEQDILELCSRKGSVSGTPIMDVVGNSIIEFHNDFISYWEDQNEFKENGVVKTFILILNRVRNNLFHGGKSFSIESDCEILRLTCPILKRITFECINSIR
jgi:hypothetical protein